MMDPAREIHQMKKPESFAVIDVEAAAVDCVEVVVAVAAAVAAVVIVSQLKTSFGECSYGQLISLLLLLLFILLNL